MRRDAAGRISQGDLALIRSSIASTRSDSVALSNSIDQLSYRLTRLIGSGETIRPIISETQFSPDGLWSDYPLSSPTSSILAKNEIFFEQYVSNLQLFEVGFLTDSKNESVCFPERTFDSSRAVRDK